MSDPKLPSPVPAPDDARASHDATDADPRDGRESAPQRAATEQLPAARPYVPLEDEEEDDEPTATLAEEAPPVPRSPPRRTHTEPLQPVAGGRTPTPPRALRPVGPDPWANVPDGVSSRPAPPVPTPPPRSETPPARTRELQAADARGARAFTGASLDDESFEVTDPVDPRELARARASRSTTDVPGAEAAPVEDWEAPPGVLPEKERRPLRRARAERLAPAPVPSSGFRDDPAPAPTPAPTGHPASPSRPPGPARAAEGEEPSGHRRAPAAAPLPPAPPAAPSPRRRSIAQLFRVDYRDNEKTAVEPVTFRPPPFWKVFPERPEWWFALSLLAVLVMGGALLWRVKHKARQEALERMRAEQEALPPWMRGPKPPPPPPGMVVVPSGSGHELRYEDPEATRPQPQAEPSGTAPPSSSETPTPEAASD